MSNLIQLILDILNEDTEDLIAPITNPKLFAEWIWIQQAFIDALVPGPLIGNQEGIHMHPRIIAMAEEHGFCPVDVQRDPSGYVSIEDEFLLEVSDEAIAHLNRYFCDEDHLWEVNEYTLDFGYWKIEVEEEVTIMAAGPVRDYQVIRDAINEYGGAIFTFGEMDYLPDTLSPGVGQLVFKMKVRTDDMDATMVSVRQVLETLGYQYVLSFHESR